jgi:hypothetical protein
MKITKHTSNIKNTRKHEKNWHKGNAQSNQEISPLMYNSSL